MVGWSIRSQALRQAAAQRRVADYSVLLPLPMIVSLPDAVFAGPHVMIDLGRVAGAAACNRLAARWDTSAQAEDPATRSDAPLRAKTITSDEPVSDVWQRLPVHWHGYVDAVAFTRSIPAHERAADVPDQVMRSPDEVALWIEHQVRTTGGVGHDVDFADSASVWRSVACRADTIVTGVGAELTITAAVVPGSDCGDCRHAGRLRPAAETPAVP